MSPNRAFMCCCIQLSLPLAIKLLEPKTPTSWGKFSHIPVIFQLENYQSIECLSEASTEASEWPLVPGEERSISYLPLGSVSNKHDPLLICSTVSPRAAHYNEHCQWAIPRAAPSDALAKLVWGEAQIPSFINSPRDCAATTENNHYTFMLSL